MPKLYIPALGMFFVTVECWRYAHTGTALIMTILTAALVIADWCNVVER